MLSSLGWLGKRGTDRSLGCFWRPEALWWMTGPCIFAQGLPGGPEIVGPSLSFSSKTKYPPGLLWGCYFGGVPGFLSVRSVLHRILHREVPAAFSCAWAWVRLLQVHRCHWCGTDALTLQSGVSSHAAFSVGYVHIPLCAVYVAVLINFECFGFESLGKSKFWGN